MRLPRLSDGLIEKTFYLFLLAVCLSPNEAFPDFEKKARPEGYTYLMYSDPMYLKYSDGTRTKIQVTARARRRQDDIQLVIDDKIKETGRVSFGNRRITFNYSEEGLSLRVQCISLRAEDATYNHACTVYSGERRLGVLDVINRIYPENKTPD